MKWKVELYDGQFFTETVRARTPNDAKETALSRNPNATVVSVNVSFF